MTFGLTSAMILPISVAHSSDIPVEITSKLQKKLISDIESNRFEDRVYDVLVACDKDSDSDYLAKATRHVRGMTITETWDALGGFRADATSSEILRLAELPFVIGVEMNSEVSVCMDTAREYTNVDWLAQPWIAPDMDGDMDGDPYSYSKDDVVIAVLDTGIHPGHVEFNNGKIIGWVDVVGDKYGIIHDTPYDDHAIGAPGPPIGGGPQVIGIYHGTHCASIAAGGLTGVAKGAALVGVKVLNHAGGGSTADVVFGLNWVSLNKDLYGIDVVSISLGDSRPEYIGTYSQTSLYTDYLVAEGLVVCVAAGNEGPGENTIGPPGTAELAITVGNAADPGEGGWELHYKSSRGLPGGYPREDGWELYESTSPEGNPFMKPDVLAPGVEIMAAKGDTTSEYHELTGTSMATPFVAGLVALWLDKDYSLRLPLDYPNPWHPKVKYLLMASAKNMPDDPYPGYDVHYGAGRVDAMSQYWLYEQDISKWMYDAPTALYYSYAQYSLFNENLWPGDLYDGLDWYKIYCHQGLLISALVIGDSGLVLRVKLYDRNGNLLRQSSAGRVKSLGHTAPYKGRYYVQVSCEGLSWGEYDIYIVTTPAS